MFGLKKTNAIIVLLTSVFIFSQSLSAAERTAKFYALCITGSPFENGWFVHVFIIEAKDNSPWIEPSASISLDRQTLEPVLDKNRYRIISRRFLLQIERLYQIISSETNSSDSTSFSFQGELKKISDSSFGLTYKYEENKAGECLKLEGTVQLEPDKIQIIGGSMREKIKTGAPNIAAAVRKNEHRGNCAR